VIAIYWRGRFVITAQASLKCRAAIRISLKSIRNGRMGAKAAPMFAKLESDLRTFHRFAWGKLKTGLFSRSPALANITFQSSGTADLQGR
jgi:hypothetical protein